MHTKYKLYIQAVTLKLPLLKSTKNVVTIFGNHFLETWYKFSNPKLFHVYNEVFTYFQKAIIAIFAKYVVTFLNFLFARYAN